MAFEYGRQRILLPVKPGFIVASIGVAFALNLLPWQDIRGVPDLLALVIAFWCVHQPRKVGIGVAWTLGLFMDAANGTLFGQYALAYAALAYGAHALHRRILRFPLWQQALHVLGIAACGAGSHAWGPVNSGRNLSLGLNTSSAASSARGCGPSSLSYCSLRSGARLKSIRRGRFRTVPGR